MNGENGWRDTSLGQQTAGHIDSIDRKEPSLGRTVTIIDRT